MYLGYRLFSCSKCGKEESATEQQPFCGDCNREYREELEAEKAERKRNPPKCIEDCEGYHCRECGHHYSPSGFNMVGRCDECSM